MDQASTTPVKEPPLLAYWLDRNLARPLFLLALAYLAVASGVIHRVGHGYITLFEVQLIAWFLVAAWPVFAVEAVLRFFVTKRQVKFWPRLAILIGVLLFPPIYIGLRSYADPKVTWLPWVGWRHVDRGLRKGLAKFFSVPMILIALMVLPVLALEYIWEETMRTHFWVAFGVDLASSVIWMAFAIEFIVMLSVTEKKLAYCVQNWMDAAVVILPVIDFLPILRLWQLARILQLNQLSRLGRLYRLRGLLLKAWRAILLLEMISRLLGNYKVRRLKKLRELASAKEIELDELRKEITDLEADLALEAEKKEEEERRRSAAATDAAARASTLMAHQRDGEAPSRS